MDIGAPETGGVIPKRESLLMITRREDRPSEAEKQTAREFKDKLVAYIENSLDLKAVLKQAGVEPENLLREEEEVRSDIIEELLGRIKDVLKTIIDGQDKALLDDEEENYVLLNGHGADKKSAVIRRGIVGDIYMAFQKNQFCDPQLTRRVMQYKRDAYGNIVEGYIESVGQQVFVPLGPLIKGANFNWQLAYRQITFLREPDNSLQPFPENPLKAGSEYPSLVLVKIPKTPQVRREELPKAA